MSLCRECAKSIESVTSEKVVEALLRQRRQATLVRRRKATKIVTMVLPGARDIYYGHVSRGVALALLFSVSAVCLITGGSAFHGAASLSTRAPLWQMVAAVSLVALAYLLSARSKPSMSFKPQHHRSGAKHAAEPVDSRAHTTTAA
jgi:hypothetical protein